MMGYKKTPNMELEHCFKSGHADDNANDSNTNGDVSC